MDLRKMLLASKLGGVGGVNLHEMLIAQKLFGGGGSGGGETYTVRFWNEGTLYLTVENVLYGSSVTLPADPVKEGEYAFTGWKPEPVNIVGDMDCYAQYTSTSMYYTKIIDRSISGEYTNAIATSVGDSAFQKCTALTAVNFPLATSVGDNAFEDCTALIEADFPMATSIGVSAFWGCSNLKTLILRSETMCQLGHKNSVGSTAIANGTGYIYVPAALVDSYKAATNWSNYANRFRAIEDYPEICGGEG